MFAVSLICFLLMLAAITLMLDLRPQSFSDELFDLVNSKGSLLNQVNKAQHGKKKNWFSRLIVELKQMMDYTNQSNSFAFVVSISFILGIIGVIAACLGNNPFLIIPLAIGLCSIPLLVVKLYTYAYTNRVQKELEIDLNIVTTTYIRCDDIIKSIKENLEYMHTPVKDAFEAMITENKLVNPNLRQNIENLKNRIDNNIFREWCDGLKKCADNSSLKYILPPIVQKYAKLRHIETQIKPTINSWKAQLFGVSGLVYVNFPILAMMQNESNNWYKMLTETVFGKITIAYIVAISVYSMIRFVFLIKPPEYKV